MWNAFLQFIFAIADTIIPPSAYVQWERTPDAVPVPVSAVPIVTPPKTLENPYHEPSTETLSFASPKLAWHATRVLCDRAGLTFAQKNILCACVYQESQFWNKLPSGKPVMHMNMQSGHETSCDWGIIQVNDFWWIGTGKLFPSVQYVLDNPDKVVQWMIDYMKANGHLNRWSSYTTGAYRQWLPLTSRMWQLTG